MLSDLLFQPSIFYPVFDKCHVVCVEQLTQTPYTHSRRIPTKNRHRLHPSRKICRNSQQGRGTKFVHDILGRKISLAGTENMSGEAQY
jgi:hypothetical protein